MNLSTLLPLKILAISAGVTAGVAGIGLVAYYQLSPTADTLTGNLLIIHADNFKTHTATYDYEVSDGKGHSTPVVFKDKDNNILASSPSPGALSLQPTADTNIHASIKGKRHGKSFQVPVQKTSLQYQKLLKTTQNKNAIKTISTTSLPHVITAASSGSTPRTVAIIATRFSDTSGSFTPNMNSLVATLTSDPSSPNAYYLDESNNVTGFTATWTGQVTLPDTTPGDCANSAYFTTLTTHAIAQAGIDPTQFNHVIVALPAFANCLSRGIVGGNPGIVEAIGYDPTGQTAGSDTGFSTGALTHELGHNLGLQHANLYHCPGASIKSSDDSISGTIQINSQCTTEEYADSFDPMGDNDTGMHLNYVHTKILADLFNWTHPTVHVVTAAESGKSYTLAPIGFTCTQTKILDIKRNPNDARIGTDLYVEYRQAIPNSLSDSSISNGDPASLGVEIHGQSAAFGDNSGGDSQLIGILLPGKTLTDAVGGFSITMNGSSNQGANVTVTYN